MSLARALVPEEPLRPPLKWAGGKRWLLPRLAALWAPHARRRLVEPFVGGLSVALGLRPAAALLGDINPHVIGFYEHLQRGLAVRVPMRNDERLYYAHRGRFNELTARGETGSAEAAQLFYFLNRTGYNGLCRFNSRGEFNVPFGRYTTISYDRDFHAYRAPLERWRFEARSYQELRLEPGDFVYADPPYDLSFTKYSAQDFTWDDQVRLARWLGAHPGPVVASNRATARILDLYRGLGFRLSVLPAPRRISCTGDRSATDEVVAVKNL